MFPVVALQLGWRPALLATAGLCLLGLPATWRIVRTSSQVVRPAGEQRGLVPSERAFVAWLTSYTFFMGIGVNAFLTYTPIYAVTLGRA